MSDPLLTPIAGTSLDEFLKSLGTIHKALPPELGQQLKEVFVNYLTKYGGNGAYTLMNGRTVAQILNEFEPAEIQPIDSGTINGVEYRLYVPEKNGNGDQNEDK